jgi:2-polyprenyl-6-methoxyphenol hydroxylase-like FAD-dependent oxidoreductase
MPAVRGRSAGQRRFCGARSTQAAKPAPDSPDNGKASVRGGAFSDRAAFLMMFGFALNAWCRCQSRPKLLPCHKHADDVSDRTVLISGAGIAGPTLAFWLNAAGLSTTIVEHAPALRTGGYVIDFWGLGYDIAERMGLTSDVERVGYHMNELRIVDDHGDRITGFGTRVFRELTGGRFVTIGRSDLSRLLFDKIKQSSNVIFGDEIVHLDEGPDAVQVQFRSGMEQQFDLVIGADGLHSNVRKFVFGPQAQFEKQLGYMVAAFEVRGYRPRDEGVYVIYGEAGRMIGRFALHDDRTLFLFVYAAAVEPQSAMPSLSAQKAALRGRFGDGKWECQRILDELEQTQDLYFDHVSQIKMERWSKGRIALVGDAAFCVSLMAGQGSALAMTAAYVMAGELAKARGSHGAAFASYETTLRAFIESKQQAAGGFAAAFAPKTRWGVFVRNQVIRMLGIPRVARIAFGRDLTDSLKLPEYPWTVRTLAAR